VYRPTDFSVTINTKSIIKQPNAAFTHAGLTTKNRTKRLHESIFVLSRSRDMYRKPA